MIDGGSMKNSQFARIYDDRDKGYGIRILDHCPTQRANRGGVEGYYERQYRNGLCN